MKSIRFIAGLLTGVFVLLAHAQPVDDPTGSSPRVAPRIDRDPAVSLRMPDDIPAVPAFDTMTEFLVPDLSDRQAFAIDPASFRLEGKVVMVTVTAASKTGAQTSGYYGFNCDNGQYRLLGFPSSGKWKASTRTKWRIVRGIKSRPSQFVPLYAAACAPDGTPVRNARELTTSLAEDNPRTD